MKLCCGPLAWGSRRKCLPVQRGLDINNKGTIDICYREVQQVVFFKMDIFRHAFFFFNRYRSRIAIGTIIAIAAAVYYMFFHEPQARKRQAISESTGSGRRLNLVEMGTLSPNHQAGVKARLLLRIRKQFDISIRIFIPTLRKSIFDLIDITQPVKQIKQLRANNASNNNGHSNGSSSSSASFSHADAEAQLWEEVKLSSFTMLFVTTYVLCGLTTLLKVQLHVLARAILRGEGPALESLGATGDNADDIVMYARDSALLKKFIEGTFRTMFGAGLQRFADDIRQRLKYLLRDWIVKERMRVDFEDMLQLLNTVRRDFESDFDTLMRSLFCEQAPEAVYAYHGLGISDRAPSSRTATGAAGNKKDDPRAERLLTQLRHAIDNPLFSVVYRESADAAFRMVVDNLRRFVFLSSDLLTPISSQPTTPVKTTNGHHATGHHVDGNSSKRPVSTPSPMTSGSTTNGHTSTATSPVLSSSSARRTSLTNGSPVPHSPPNTLLRPSSAALNGSSLSSSSSSSSTSSLVTKKSPPLASILPQLKSLSARLLPETADAVNPYDLKSLTSGPLLESFCMTIFDAEDMMRVG